MLTIAAAHTTLPLSEKAIVPAVGAGVTTAVKVMLWPTALGLTGLESVDVVAVPLTCWVRVLEPLGA